MTNREREQATLNFGRPQGRGSVEETFYPWDLTVGRFHGEGLPEAIWKGLIQQEEEACEKYFKVSFGEPVLAYESYLGFDPVRRAKFLLPHGGDSGMRIASPDGWEAVRETSEKEVARWFTDENIGKVYGSLAKGHEDGDYSVRMNIEGFFWVPRELLGIEAHMYAFYDEPELLHAINDYILEIYRTKLLKVIDLVQPDVIYFMEDLSGKNGPMVSPDCFEEFVADYYRALIPLFKKHGVGNVFVDTDGDFARLIPNFMDAGVDGFLPMDVNAGMDIVEVRKQFPKLKFIGSFNKLEIAKGPEAIDKEFDRILPVIRGGGYIPGSDHQVAPSTSLENYQYYIKKLKKIMEQAGADL